MHDTMPPMKNQQSCGSCWAFAGIATVEAAYYQKNQKIISLSEMQMTACAKQRGCGGGWMYHVYDYGKSKGIALEKDYPYCDACADSTCHSYVGSNCMQVSLTCYRANAAVWTSGYGGFEH